MQRVLSWLRDLCPYCHERLSAEQVSHTVIRRCPHNHFRIESHAILGVEIEFHSPSAHSATERAVQ